MELALYRPEIPQNTGNIGRIAVCTNSRLHIIGEPSFSLSEAAVRRAGLDYWPKLHLTLHENWEEFVKFFDLENTGRQKALLIFTKFASRKHSEHKFSIDDILLFGRESSGLPSEIKEFIGKRNPDHALRIPVRADCRSLNPSNAVSIALYEGLRQLDYPDLEISYPAETETQ